jgi:hypothetical protein
MTDHEADAVRVAEIRERLAANQAVEARRGYRSLAVLMNLEKHWSCCTQDVAWLLADRERQAAENERLRAQITAVLYQIEVARSENRLAPWQAGELAQTVERLLAGNVAAETGERE